MIRPASTSSPRSRRDSITGSSTSSVERPCERAVLGGHSTRFVDRDQHGQVVDARELEVLGAGARRDVDDPGALGERDLVPRDHPVDDSLLRRQVVERAFVLEPDELLTPDDPVVVGVLLDAIASRRLAAHTPRPA